MKVASEIFKAYDIRGTYPDQLNADVAYAVGRTARAAIAPQKQRPKIAVGMDTRLSSPELKNALIRGLLESGANVDDIGLVSTPTFYLVVARYGYDGGIQVSASHNPKEWNGFKLVGPQAVALGYKTGIDTVHAVIGEDRLPPPAARSGALKAKPELPQRVLQEQLETLRKEAGAIKPFTVVFDGGNGMGGLDMQAAFSPLPCHVLWMNEKPDGTFPAHPADPMIAENTHDLRVRTIREGADLGIASDGDGDRYFFFDEKGEVVPQEILRGLLAQIELAKHPGATIVYDVRPGRITKDLIEAAGGKAVLAPVGHSLIKEKMIQEDAVFGGESSGHFFYKLPFGTFESPLVLVYTFLQFLSEQSKPLSEIVAPYKRYFNSGENNVRLMTREKGLAILKRLKETYRDGKQTTLDGLTVEYPDFTFNVRLSNTEPLIRLIVESADQATMEKRRDEVLEILKG